MGVYTSGSHLTRSLLLHIAWSLIALVMVNLMVNLIVNDIPRQMPDGATVESLLNTLGLQPRFLAVELNLRVVPRTEHRQTLLADGDRVEIVTLVGGG